VVAHGITLAELMKYEQAIGMLSSPSACILKH